MVKKEYIPYTYLIGWSRLNRWYYGAEYKNNTKIANPSNLWKCYFTSSKIVKEFIREHGQPDIIEVRKIFKNGQNCRNFEQGVLKKLKVNIDEKWLNIHIGGKNFTTFGKILGESNPAKRETVRRKISETLKNKVWTEEEKNIIKNSQRNRPPVSEETRKKHSLNSKGRTHTEKSKKKMREIQSNRQTTYKHSDEIKILISKKNKGRKFSDEHRQKISSALKGRIFSYEHKQKISNSKKLKDSN